MRRAEVRYRADWTPEVFELEATVNGGDTQLQTTFDGQEAVTQGIDGGQKISQKNFLPASRILVLPNVFFGTFEALTRRLIGAAPGQEFPAFLGAGALGTLRLVSASTERMQVGTSIFNARRYEMTFTNPRGTTAVNLYADETGTLLRVNLPDADDRRPAGGSRLVHGAHARVFEPRRRSRQHSGRRLQPGRDAHAAEVRGRPPAGGDSSWRRRRERSRRCGRRRADPRTARGRARRRRFRRGPLRQARIRTERRPR